MTSNTLGTKEQICVGVFPRNHFKMKDAMPGGFELKIYSPIQKCLASVSVVLGKRLLLHPVAPRQLLGSPQEDVCSLPLGKDPQPTMELLGSPLAILLAVVRAAQYQGCSGLHQG